ncbi:DNA mismatch repair endonuclease MutL [Candidatus Contubernalis alkaliaceticus]|uniref:DNA mismatch repair endonuclease MutL n=1 Tax=Candidatus Contubernalis alkaliaceticus TaxID=338645 RepID=UPI001F4C035C|nr:DNA mismatch repair endonuclease MutL [Candidatus Contubernalis alkalaceticus]UNC91897.1 DNA mismatch repair endonuclease MutL [Candidatus Contubernalis alkalaceticus]
MAGIIILDPETVNQIAAGEVIERPASVIKELVENSIDASAEKIDIEVKEGGLSFIRIVDNGTGMSRQDTLLALERHATSKIKRAEDLQRIQTLGFRGEALSSIAAVSRMRLRTRLEGELSATEIKVVGGEVSGLSEKGCPVGTEVQVEDLFFNTPARRKFLKKPSLETGRITDLVNRMALSYPTISFSLAIDGRQVLKTRGSGDLLEIIAQVYGREKARQFIPVDFTQNSLKINGYTGKPSLCRSNRGQQTFFINNRYIKSIVISRALEEAYGTLLLKNFYPSAVLFITVEPDKVDVNVHPGKAEVRFADEKEIHSLIFESIKDSLKKHTLIPEVSLSKKTKEKNYKQVSFFLEGVNTTNQESSCKPYHKVSMIEDMDKIPSEKRITNTANTCNHESAHEQIRSQNHDSSVTRDEKAVLLFEGRKVDNHEIIGEQLIQEIKVLGQFLGTYILVQREQDLLLVDQHAAHERILYEKLKGQFQREIRVQEVIPRVLELEAGTETMSEEIRDFCRELNFEVDIFGSGSLVLRGVPNFIKDIYSLSFVEDLISSFLSGGNNQEKAKEESIIMMACKAACKANMKMTIEGMKALVEDLFKTELPYTCPHGRPTMIVLTQDELEKNFKRRL